LELQVRKGQKESKELMARKDPWVRKELQEPRAELGNLEWRETQESRVTQGGRGYLVLMVWREMGERKETQETQDREDFPGNRVWKEKTERMEWRVKLGEWECLERRVRKVLLVRQEKEDERGSLEKWVHQARREMKAVLVCRDVWDHLGKRG
jgi:hypothetical protein